jgi:hypothetical protein
MNDADVAVAVLLAPALTPTAPPTGLPPVAQPLALVSGPQAKKLTVPLGLPPVTLPVTVAWSMFEPPMVMPFDPGVLVVTDDAWVTVKHSVLLPSEDAA